MNKFLYISLSVCLLLWGISESYLQYSNKTFSKEEIDESFEPITSKYGVKIVYEISEDFLSNLENPPIPAGPGRNSKLTPIRHRVLLHYPTILQKAFAKYPVQVVKDHLSAIHFAGEIKEGDLKYGGTYDPFRKILYIVDNGLHEDYHSVYVVHHEFSSLLLTRHSFFVNPWTDNNPQDFKYSYETGKNTLEIYNNITFGGNAEFYKNGILTDYGQTNFENDFNEYSAMIFTYPEKFKKIMNQYPRVHAKFKVWLDYYNKIDPIFTEAYLLGNS